MTVVNIRPQYYEGLAADTKPTDAPVKSVYRETDTNMIWITYVYGTWVEADKRIRLVEEDGTFIDLPTELAAIVTAAEAVETAVAALGYEFTINGVNFNGYAKIKTLTLDGNAEDDDPITLHDEGVDYVVPTGKVFICFQALVWLQQVQMIGRIGESDSADGAITKEVLKLSQGNTLPFLTNCHGVFTAGKYITAETDSASDNYTIQSGSVLYGVEVDA